MPVAIYIAIPVSIPGVYISWLEIVFDPEKKGQAEILSMMKMVILNNIFKFYQYPKIHTKYIYICMYIWLYIHWTISNFHSTRHIDLDKIWYPDVKSENKTVLLMNLIYFVHTFRINWFYYIKFNIRFLQHFISL